jgi:hypothetical protein
MLTGMDAWGISTWTSCDIVTRSPSTAPSIKKSSVSGLPLQPATAATKIENAAASETGSWVSEKDHQLKDDPGVVTHNTADGDTAAGNYGICGWGTRC